MAETGAFADVLPTPTPATLTPAQRLRAIVGGSAGNLVEWYDWFAYTSFSLYFASSFFPKGDETSALLQAALLNIVSFGARPIGAWIMGSFADRAGRKTALIVAVLMMCVGSLIMACAPTYAQIGGLAPWILAGARLLQGLSVGGQYGAAATYMSEVAPRHGRGFWSSFQYVTLIAGQLLAVIVLMILQRIYPESALKDWAWRIAFWFGAFLAIVVFVVQAFIHESHSFKNMKEKAKTSMAHTGAVVLFLVLTLAAYVYSLVSKDGVEGAKIATYILLGCTAVALMAPLVTKFPKQALAIIGLTIAGTSGFYAYTTYMLKFLQAKHGDAAEAIFTKPEATNINFAVLIIFMVCQPLFGHLADRFGRKTMLMIAFGLGAAVAYPAFTAIATTHSYWTAVALCSAPLIVLSGYTSISAVVKAELFPAHLRALGVALPYAIANAAAGAAVEPLALSWKKAGTESTFYIYIAILMIVGFLAAAFLLHETRNNSQILED